MLHVYVRGTYEKKHIHVCVIKFHQTLFLQMTDDHLKIRMYDKKVSQQCFINMGLYLHSSSFCGIRIGLAFARLQNSN